MTHLFETLAADLDGKGFAIWRGLLPHEAIDLHLTAYRSFAAEMGPQAGLDQPVAKRSGSPEYRAQVHARTEQFHLTASQACWLWHHPELRRFAAWRFGTEAVARVIGTHLFSLSNLQNDNLHTDYLSTAAPQPWEREFRVWCALEDIHPSSGPIHFYPGTHRSVAIPMRDDLAARPEIHAALVASMQSTTHLQLIETLRPFQQTMGEELRRRVNQLGISPVTPELRKGDAILFNPGIAHATTPPSDPERTRCAVIFFLGASGNEFYSPRAYFGPLHDHRSPANATVFKVHAPTAAYKSSTTTSRAPPPSPAPSTPFTTLCNFPIPNPLSNLHLFNGSSPEHPFHP